YHPLLLIELNQIDRMLKISKEENLIQQHQVARQLIRGVAHEIKNPLGGIRGATQLLARSLNDPQYAEFTDIIISEVDRLRNLADTMLGSRQLPSYEPVNVHEPLERVRALIVNQTKKKIKITRDYDLSLPDVMADRDQLIQVMLNISVNAVQAMTENKEFFSEHQPELILRTRIQRLVTINGVLKRSAVRIDIEDNGPGVPEEILESVFYPLVTGRAKGTGLGLSIAQNIMHQHNGMIVCQSVPGKTVFSLYLPWESDHAAK
ncbi:MAG: PAS domain-containing sensor histidine kinase, partial [Acinetobacter sp.]|nr:PAS domain-containing sensor histidine kinase [Acinetobacter sp.]